jgi:hypothetical protein
VKVVFLKFADKSTDRIPSAKFHLALEEFGIEAPGLDSSCSASINAVLAWLPSSPLASSSSATANHTSIWLPPPAMSATLHERADTDRDGGVDFEDFFRAINRPSELEQWCSNLPLARLLGCCLEAATATTTESSPAATPDPVRRVSALSPREIDAVAGEFAAGLSRILAEHVEQLRHCYRLTDSKATEAPDGSGAKFQSFSAGAVGDFHKGLTDRVGPAIQSI